MRDFYVLRSHLNSTLFEPSLSQPISRNHNFSARNVYYPYDFEAHKNLSHKQFALSVNYFMDTPVCIVGKFFPTSRSFQLRIPRRRNLVIKYVGLLLLERYCFQMDW